MRQKVKKDELKVGDIVYTPARRKITSIEGQYASANGWLMALRKDDYWGADNSSGFLEKDDGKLPKYIVYWDEVARPDPVFLCNTLDEAKSKIDELLSKVEVIRETILLFHIGQTQKPKITMTLEKV